MATIKSINPYTGELNWEFELMDERQIDEIINIAHDAYLEWKDTPKSEKKALFLKLADVIEEDIEENAKIQTMEMWMLYKDSLGWLKATISLIRWFANNFEDILASKEFENNEWIKWKVIYDPIWVIFGIAPWNFPYNQLLRAAVPNILAWNTQIYKHSSNVPLCALKIQDFFDKAWFKEGIYTNMFVSSSKSEQIISNKYIAWVNLTGSEWAWSSVWALAGKYLKPSVLELWGNDAFVLWHTENIDRFVDFAVSGRLKNGWQACNASKRFIILEEYFDEFCKKYSEKMWSLVIWDPINNATQMQPLISKQSIEEIKTQVDRAVSTWARVLTWWNIVKGKGNFFEPTVLEITRNTSSFNEEIFWPVASVIKSKNIEESIFLANSTDFWLSASVWWDDDEELKKIANKLEWWMIFINAVAWSKSSLPFGWVKKSWYWKENWEEGLKAFVNKKVVLY